MCFKIILAKHTSITLESPEAREMCSNLQIHTQARLTMTISGTRAQEAAQMAPEAREVPANKPFRATVEIGCSDQEEEINEEWKIIDFIN
jgi:hypothetical protein